MLKQLSHSDLTQILQSCPMGIALSDSEQKIIWVNKTFEEYLGISASEISGMSIDDLPDVLKPLFTSTSAVHIPANTIRDDQWFMCSQQQVENNTTHFITDVGPLHLLMKERDVLKEELREALAVDEVTGMPNKVALFQSLEPQISRSRRYNNLLSIVIMRVNNLEQLNEDQTASIMLPISQMLNDQVRWADIVGKLNESDFLLVLPETAADACKNLTYNLGERLKGVTLPDGLPENYTLSASFGYSEWAKGDDLVLLMQKARKVLEDK
ncbi:MAG TPA: diguanylate cyclase [Gammaproteobacteria bacterium]|nr:diguanylate cyclase [Gammaproteobacteria bacterium]